MLLIYYGFTVDLISNLSVLLASSVKAMYVVAEARHNAIVERELHQSLSPGEQYRIHINNGGFRI